MENQSKKMVQIVYDALDEKLGEDIEILKVDEISVIADYLVIANGRNQNQLNAMTDLVEEKMIEAGYKSKRIARAVCDTPSFFSRWVRSFCNRRHNLACLHGFWLF